MGFIYLIISPNGKHYVGMTIHTVAERIKGHKKNSSNCKLLKASANKYGWDNMKAEMVLNEYLKNLKISV
jgi:predicted GIY-YIG superfamily endonuclease